MKEKELWFIHSSFCASGSKNASLSEARSKISGAFRSAPNRSQANASTPSGTNFNSLCSIRYVVERNSIGALLGDILLVRIFSQSLFSESLHIFSGSGVELQSR